VIDLYLGRRTAGEILSAASKPEERCEAQFYLGEWHLLRGKGADAKSALRSTVETCPKISDAYQGAVADLMRLEAVAMRR
jgi:hypothetical protein